MAQLTYQQSGVDIDVGNLFVKKIKPLVKKTRRPEVMSPIGGFAGLFQLDSKKYKNPLLVSSTDGVGTKLKLGIEWNLVEGLGQDLVAMSANDLLCLGAEPLFFLDYFATGKLTLEQALPVIRGITKACREIHCALLGGETAEMPGVYAGKDFDLAGFIVGVVEKDRVIEGRTIRPGDSIIGLASSGFHSNGFSLVRRVLERRKLETAHDTELHRKIMAPTKLYVNQVLKLKDKFDIRGIAHITGGGLLENIPRVLPPKCKAVIDTSMWPRPEIFQKIQEWGEIEEVEMQRVFNCGIGLMLVVPTPQVPAILKYLKTMKEKAWVIGEIVKRKHAESNIEVFGS